MYVTDPVGDFLTRIRNAQLRKIEKLELPASKMLVSVAEILKQEGFINGFEVVDQKPQKLLRVELKYVDGEAAIKGLKRMSKPGIRKYIGYRQIPSIRRGLGITVFSTPKGILTGEQAKAAHVGGEFICLVY